MEYKEFKIIVTQEVSIVVGETTRLYDTVLVKYLIDNKDTRAHTVGMRVLFDTFIGSEDGVPFEVGPSEERKEISMEERLKIFDKRQVPQYLRAIEDVNKMNDPNTTIAVMGLKLKLKNLEEISRVVICRWPNIENGGAQANWEWKFEPIDKLPDAKDSCVVHLLGHVQHAQGRRSRLCLHLRPGPYRRRAGRLRWHGRYRFQSDAALFSSRGCRSRVRRDCLRQGCRR